MALKVHEGGFKEAVRLRSGCLCCQVSGTALHDKVDWSQKSIGELLLEPTKIYVKSILNLTKNLTVKVLPILPGGPSL